MNSDSRTARLGIGNVLDIVFVEQSEVWEQLRFLPPFRAALLR